MKTTTRFALLSLVILTGAAGCASKPGAESKAVATPKTEEQILDAKVQAEPSANTPDEIADRGAFDFITAPGLSREQKQKVMAIYVRVYKQAMDIRSEIGKSKSLLFKTVASQDFDSKDVQRLKDRIVKLDQKRLEIMFKALEDVQDIVGYGTDKEEIYKHFRDYEYPRNEHVSQAN